MICKNCGINRAEEYFTPIALYRPNTLSPEGEFLLFTNLCYDCEDKTKREQSKLGVPVINWNGCSRVKEGNY